jgi:hypothetical protein
MTDRGQLIKSSEGLMWKSKKGDIGSILTRIERLETLVDIALQMDDS